MLDVKVRQTHLSWNSCFFIRVYCFSEIQNILAIGEKPVNVYLCKDAAAKSQWLFCPRDTVIHQQQCCTQ